MEHILSKFQIGWVSIMILCGVFYLASGVSAQIEVLDENQPPGRALARQATKGQELWITADHSLHKPLQGEFSSGPQVTEACLTCHELAAGQFQKTIHWTWLDPNVDPALKVGKAGLTVNNFCINSVTFIFKRPF